MNSTFEARMQELVERRQQQLQQLQAEKELQARKMVELEQTVRRVRALRYECLVLKQDIASLNCKTLATEREIEEARVRLESTLENERDLDIEIENLEVIRAENVAVYKARRTEMAEYHKRVLAHLSSEKQEIEDLKTQVATLEARLQDARKMKETARLKQEEKAAVYRANEEEKERLTTLLQQKREETEALSRECNALELQVFEAINRQRQGKGEPSIKQ